MDLNRITHRRTFTPIVILTRNLIVAPMNSPTTTKDNRRQLIITLRARNRLLQQRILRHTTGNNTTNNRRHRLIYLRITRQTQSHLLNQRLTQLIQLRRGTRHFTNVSNGFRQVLIITLSSNLHRARFIFRLTTNARTLLRATSTLLRRTYNIRYRNFTNIIIRTFRISTGHYTRILPRAFTLALSQFQHEYQGEFNQNFSRLQGRRTFRISTHVINTLSNIFKHHT